MLLTPLGILAAGTAWGEWSASRFSTAEGRAGIVASSRNQPLPDTTPAGLATALHGVDRADSGLRASVCEEPHFGYLLSAAFGVGLLMLSSAAVQAYLQRGRAAGPAE